MKKNIYLISVVVSFILASLVHGKADVIFTTASVLRFYVGLFIISIPMMIFLFFVRKEIVRLKHYLGLFIGYLVGFLIITVFAILRVIDPSNVIYGLNGFIYGALVLLPTLVMSFFIYLSYKEGTFSFSDQLGFMVIIVSYAVFMLSTMKGFYFTQGNVVVFSGRFLTFSAFFEYVFNGSFLYALTFILLISSTYVKAQILSSVHATN